MEEYLSKLTVFTHPLIRHKVSHLCDVNTGTKEFSELVKELSMLMGYEVLKDLKMKDVEIQAPLQKIVTPVLAEDFTIVPILRAGLGMVDGLLELVPAARVGHIGMYRDEETHEPHEYYCKLPVDVEQRICLLVDPMLATGGSATAALGYLRKQGVRDVRLLCIVAAPEGIAAVQEADPDVHIYTCSIDDGLNDAAYIVPGLGDAGDRIFGTL